MSSWRGKTRGGLLGYQIFIFILQKTGLAPAYLLLRFVAFYYTFSSPKSTVANYRYFRGIMKLSTVHACISVYKSYYIFGQTIIDKIAIGMGKPGAYTYTFDGIENLKKLKQTGGIVISAHLGSWDIAAHLLEDIDLKINLLIFEAEHEKIKNYLEQIMHKRTINIIAIRNDLSHIFKINSALRNKEVICVHGDRFTERGRVVQKMFLGHKAYFPAGPFTIVSKLAVPYTFAYAVRGKKRKYHLSATPIKQNAAPDELMEEYIKNLEKKVRANPLQWFNYYDFWSEDVKGATVE